MLKENGLVPTNAGVPEPISSDRPVETSRRRRLSHQRNICVILREI